MNTVRVYRGGKTSEISSKWLPRFKADGWKTSDGEAEAEPETPAPEKVSSEDMAELIEASETKDELEALVKDAFDVDLDKRKGLDKLKAEALELVNSNEG